MTTTLHIALLFAYWVSGLIVLAESLNKLERTNVRQQGASIGMRVVTALKILAWLLLAIGAAGAIITPLLPLANPSLRDVAVLGGFALLIIRTRVKDEVLSP